MNAILRRADRAVKDIKDILSLVGQAKVLRLGLLDDGYPHIVPLHYGFEYNPEMDAFTFYMHGSREGRKLDLIRLCPHACVEIEGNVELVSGGNVACKYGARYSSFIGRGEAAIVEEPSEKLRALKLLMLHQTDREFEITEQAAAAVSVVKAVVNHYSAKARV